MPICFSSFFLEHPMLSDVQNRILFYLGIVPLGICEALLIILALIAGVCLVVDFISSKLQEWGEHHNEGK